MYTIKLGTIFDTAHEGVKQARVFVNRTGVHKATPPIGIIYSDRNPGAKYRYIYKPLHDSDTGLHSKDLPTLKNRILERFILSQT